MSIRAGQFLRPRSGRHLLAFFAITILLPGVLLAVFAVRALLQERQFMRQQVRERIEHAADLAARDLQREFDTWRRALDTVDARGGEDVSTLPESLRTLLVEPGAGAIVLVGSNDRRVWPSSQTSYDLDDAIAEGKVPNGLPEDVEELELRDRNYPSAVAVYRRLLRTATSNQRAWLLHVLARTYRKAGRADEALATWRELGASRDRVGLVPASFIAAHETCGLSLPAGEAHPAPCVLDLYRGLVDGRWRLPKSRYVFYADEVRRRLSAADAGTRREFDRLHDIDVRKLALTDAAERLSIGGRPIDLGTHMAVWRSAERGGHAEEAAVLLEKARLASDIWPHTFAAVRDGGFDVRLLVPADVPVFESKNGAKPVDLSSTRASADAAIPWRLQIWPRDQTALSSDLSRRQTFLFVMLGLVTALLGFGTYLTARVVHREMEIARLQADFVSTVSHEFRSPLTGIRQLGEMLMHGRVPSDARRQEYYERITRESDRLSRLVENVLDFSRMEDGRRQYRFEPLDVSRWLRETVATIGSYSTARPVSIVATIPDGLPPVVGDHGALTLALQNLIDNAIKYSPGSDTVWLEAAANGGGIAIRIRDRGVGIAAAERPRIFEKFYRAPDEITREVKGAGLGLSLVQHVVTAHGGRIECESAPGQGSTFTIHLRAAGA